MAAYANEAEVTYPQVPQKVNWFFFLEGVFFMWMLPMIIFQYQVSDIIQAKNQVLRSDTLEVSSIFNLHMIFFPFFFSSWL